MLEDFLTEEIFSEKESLKKLYFISCSKVTRLKFQIIWLREYFWNNFESYLKERLIWGLYDKVSYGQYSSIKSTSVSNVQKKFHIYLYIDKKRLFIECDDTGKIAIYLICIKEELQIHTHIYHKQMII